MFLAETLTNEARLEFIQSSIGFDHWWVVPRVGRGGGLDLFWRSSINLIVEGSNKYYVLVWIVLKRAASAFSLFFFFPFQS